MAVGQVLALLKDQRRGCVLVVDGEQLMGIFTERDAVRMMAAGRPLDVPIHREMSTQPVTVTPSDSVESAIREMSEGGYRHLPVVDDDGRPTGVLSVANVLHYLVEHFPQYVYNLPPVPHHSLQQREGA